MQTTTSASICPPLILASKSPQRKAILSACGFTFIQCNTKVHELKASPTDKPLTLVTANAKRKATASALVKTYPRAHIIGADTLVCCQQKIFEKPRNQTAARAMFAAYRQSSAISVYTAITLYSPHTRELSQASDHSILKPRTTLFKTQAAFQQYAKTITQLKHSGGFSIEGLGAAMFDNIQGSFYTVLGMPLHLLFQLMSTQGIDVYKYLTAPASSPINRTTSSS